MFYTYEIMREYDWKYAIAPYVYLGVAYIFVRLASCHRPPNCTSLPSHPLAPPARLAG